MEGQQNLALFHFSVSIWQKKDEEQVYTQMGNEPLSSTSPYYREQTDEREWGWGYAQIMGVEECTVPQQFILTC